MLNASFWRDAAERAGKTVAQALLGLYLANDVIGLTNVSVVHALDVAGLAGVISVLTSVVSSKVGNDSSASLVK